MRFAKTIRDSSTLTMAVSVFLPERWKWDVAKKGAPGEEVFSFRAVAAAGHRGDLPPQPDPDDESETPKTENFKPVKGQLETFRVHGVRTVCAEFFAIDSPNAALEFLRKFGPLETRHGNKHAQPSMQSGKAGAKTFYEMFNLETGLLTRTPSPLSRHEGMDAAAREPVPKADPVTWSALSQIKTDFEDQLVFPNALPLIVDRLVWGQSLNLQLQLFPVSPEQKLPRGWKLPRKESMLPSAYVACTDVLHAIRTGIALGLVTHSRWSRCARPKCGKIFEQNERYLTRYCSERCAKAESSRRAYEKKSKRHQE